MLPSTLISSELCDNSNDNNPLKNYVVLEHVDIQVKVKNPCNYDSNISNNLECVTTIPSSDVAIDIPIVNHNDLVNITDRLVNDTCALIDNNIDMMTHDNFNDKVTVLGDDFSMTPGNINNETNNNIEHINDYISIGLDDYVTFPYNNEHSHNENSANSTTIIDSNITKKLEIMVWNIQGLGDKLKDIDFIQYISKYDMVIFLETMKLDSYSPCTSDFVYKHFQRKYQHPRARKPAGGIGVLIKSSLETSGTVKIIKNSDFSIWIKIKQSDKIDSFLGAVYIPPLDSSSTVSSFINNNAFNLIQEEISNFSQKGNVAICGDFNARTGNLADHVEIPGSDAFDLIPFGSIDTFPAHDRHSDDVKTNKYGKDLIELCKSSNMRIMNGYFQNDKNTGAFTCYTPRGKSLIDYLICDVSFYQNLLNFNLGPISTNSDHRPLMFTVQLCDGANTHQITPYPIYNPTRYYRYIYDPKMLTNLVESLTSTSGLALNDAFIDCIVNDEGVNVASDRVYTLLETVISQNCPKKYQKTVKNRFPSNKWFDDEFM